MRGLDRAELRHRHLKIRQHFEQECLERFVRAVELIDEKNGRAVHMRFERLQQRPLDQIFFREDIVLEFGPVRRAARFGETDRHHLPGIIPFVNSRGDIEPLIALQPDVIAAERFRQNLGDFRLADTGLPFQQNGAAKFQRKEDHGR